MNMNSEKKIYGIERGYENYDMGPYTQKQAEDKILEYMSNEPDHYTIRLYKDMRNALPAIERMYCPHIDDDGNLYDADSTPFSMGDLADY